MTKLLNVLKWISANYWYTIFLWFSVLTLTADNMLVEFANMILATIALAVIEITTLIKKDTDDKSN